MWQFASRAVAVALAAESTDTTGASGLVGLRALVDTVTRQPLAGVQVAPTWDLAAATTSADGSFTLVVDGQSADEPVSPDDLRREHRQPRSLGELAERTAAWRDD